VVAAASGTTAAGAEQSEQVQSGGHGFGLAGGWDLGAAGIGAFFEHFAQQEEQEAGCGAIG
jgi:hypothetical protein